MPLIGLFASTLGSSILQAGEPVIFRNSNSKIRIPVEELRNETITPNSEGFDKKHSSVEGVMAPWQNPMNSRSSLQQKRRLLKALDQQKNWMLQDPDELLNSKQLSSEADLDDLEYSGTKSRGRWGGGKSAFERYYTKRETTNRFGSRRNSSRNSKYSDSSDRGNDREDKEDERPKDSFATPEYFEARFDSVFDDPKKSAGTKSENQNPGENEAENAAEAQRIEVFTSSFPNLGVSAQQQQPTGQGFEGLLNTTSMNMGTASQLSFSSELEQGSVARTINFGSAAAIGNVEVPGAQSPIMDSFRPTISEGLGAQSALGDTFSGSSFNSGGGASTLGLFDSNPAAQSIRNRPAVFELPKRSF